jgi:hypothetical protein
MHDLNGGVGDSLFQPVLEWKSGDERLILWSQVWIIVPHYGPIRVDFLGYYQRKGALGYWFIVEVDDRSSHEMKRNRDKARAIAVALPHLRYENHAVHQPWFVGNLLNDIRGLKDRAREWRLHRLRRARRLERKRLAEASRRRDASREMGSAGDSE